MRSATVTVGAAIVTGCLSATGTAGSGATDRPQRAACVTPLPPGSLSLSLTGRGRWIGSAGFTGCGPGSSILTISLRPGSRKGTTFYALLRPGSCTSLPAGTWYPVGFTGLVSAGVRA